jgi:predicted membrane metal-binding protein
VLVVISGAWMAWSVLSRPSAGAVGAAAQPRVRRPPPSVLARTPCARRSVSRTRVHRSYASANSNSGFSPTVAENDASGRRQFVQCRGVNYPPAPARSVRAFPAPSISIARRRSPSVFSFRNLYLETKNISGIVYATGQWAVDEERGWVGRVHRQTDIALGYGLRPQEGAVVEGMVLRDTSRIPEELEEAFRRSGITHVLAISGQHVAVLSAIIYFVLRLFAVPALFRNPTTLALMWLYIFVAGAPPSAIRAGFVATFVLAAPLFGRQLSPLHCTK